MDWEVHLICFSDLKVQIRINYLLCRNRGRGKVFLSFLFSIEKCNKKDGAGCIAIQKSLLSLTSSKILSFGKTQIHLVFRSLNRIIDIRRRYFRSTIQKKRVSFWYYPRLIVPLQAEISYKYNMLNNLIIITKQIL